MQLKSILLAVGISTAFFLNAQTVYTIGETVGLPAGIALDANGDIYVAERKPASVITKFDHSSGVSSTYKTFDTIVDPMKILFNEDGDLFVSDFNGGDIYKITAGGGTISKYVTGAALPCGMVFDADTLYYIEYISQQIFKVLPGGGSAGSANVQSIIGPEWMGKNKRGTGLNLLDDNNLIVTAALHYYIYNVNKHTGDFDTLVSNMSEGNNFDLVMLSDGLFYLPGQSTNKIYTLDTSNFNYISFLGNGQNFSTDGQDTLVSFANPYFIAKDKRDNIYVTDVGSNKIRRIGDKSIGIEEISQEMVKIYPNPASDYLNIQFEKETAFDIISNMGITMKSYQGKTSYAVPLTELNSGLYIIKTETGSTSIFFKQ